MSRSSGHPVAGLYILTFGLAALALGVVVEVLWLWGCTSPSSGEATTDCGFAIALVLLALIPLVAGQIGFTLGICLLQRIRLMQSAAIAVCITALVNFAGWLAAILSGSAGAADGNPWTLWITVSVAGTLLCGGGISLIARHRMRSNRSGATL